MPSIKQQHPTKTAPKRTGILARAKPVAELRPEFVRMVVYGENRVGKTTFACTWPKPLLLVSYEPADAGGTESVADVDGVEVMQLHTKDELIELADALKDDNPYETVCLDTGTSFQDAVLCELLGLDKLPEQMSFGGIRKEVYQRRSEIVKESLRTFVRIPAHTLILNKEKDHRPREKDSMDMTPKLVAGLKLDSFIASDLGGSTVGWLHDVCPYICRLYVAEQEETVEQEIGNTGKKVTKTQQTGRKERRLLMQLQPNFAAGFRAPTRIEVPDYIAEPTYQRFKAVMDGQLKLNGKK